MSEYVFALGEFTGSEFLELRSGCNATEPKFTNPESLYVIDDAFFSFLEALFREVVQDFDMFEDTYISKYQWQCIMKLDLTELIVPDDVHIAMQTLLGINSWVEAHVCDGCGFVVIGV